MPEQRHFSYVDDTYDHTFVHSSSQSDCLRIQLLLSWWFVGECGMESLREKEVIGFAQYFRVALRCQIHNQLLAQYETGCCPKLLSD